MAEKLGADKILAIEPNPIVLDRFKTNIKFNNYEKIIKELETNGESKQIIYAMISNLQTRISFLQNVLLHIENNEKLKNISDEKTI